MAKRALITGVAGQDGSYLAELLLDKDYDVYGMVGPVRGGLLDGVIQKGGTRLHLLEGDLTDMDSLLDVASASRPDEIYNLAAMSFVGDSWEQALTTTDVNALGALRMLETLRRECPEARFLQAVSGEVFGRAHGVAQNEATPLHPRTPYGAAKAYAFFITENYRDAHGVFGSNAVLFNHESPRRGVNFVTRKITDGAARISLGLARELRMGNLDSRRDWGFAGDYVDAMWRILQQDVPEDYVIATGEAHSVREFCEIAFGRVGLDYREHVRVDEQYMRPTDVEVLLGDATKARRQLEWEPRVGFCDLVEMMVDADLERLRGQEVEPES
ncbi:MAG: GDP-mannose 4,6-dehydratase [Coriobacteriia bacterium]|nr:GDP-mannose 4,6-dehydratase [Coriobacteriia bacterium]